jgi:tryptophanyl-tRNA synthetase
MIQFRERAGGSGQVRLSMLTYPVLMAADILLHGATEVPVGADQDQHVELARDLAIRFNRRYGDTFVVPEPVHPPFAARLMDLTDPAAKMGKSNASAAGVLRLLDPPETLRRKVMRAATDGGSEIRYDPARQPGIANLLAILAGCVGDDPATLAALFTSYEDLKRTVADAVIATLRPLQLRYADLTAEPDYLDEVLRCGAVRARERAATTVARARAAMGLPPHAIDSPVRPPLEESQP